MSSRKQDSQPHGQQSAEEENFKKPTRSNMKRSKMRGVSSGKKTAGPQKMRGSLCREPPSGSMRKTRKNKQKTPGNRDDGSTSKAPQPLQKKRAQADPTVESEEAFKNRMEVKVKIPEELKPWLVEDWDLVTRQKQLFQLPAKKNVDAILEEYANCKKSQGNVDNKEYAVNEVVAELLYKFERPQYPEILLAHPYAPMSQVYGAPHLLRLFVRIGTPLDEKSLALLLGYLHDFLKYLAKNSASLFTASDYKVASAEYHRKAL
uniref:Mortality factor 4-like protein 2 n=1 Tax=Colobus angolensis palliatus TaxID=336983 RepID=A0A2K5JRY6_COLAP